MDDKIGVFICTGYGISAALDIEALRQVAVAEDDVCVCETVASCQGAGLEPLLQAVEEHGLNKVVVAGVSARRIEPGVYPEGVIVEHVALREHVVWCQPPDDEDTQMLAEDYLRMYIAKIRKMEPLVPFDPDEQIDRTLLVVGGGVAGLTAALEAARAGYEVRLVEKSEDLGGWLARQHRSIPTRPPFRDLEDPGIDDLVASVRDHPLVNIYTSAVPTAISGAPGLFDVKLQTAPNGKAGGEPLAEFRVGAIVQATGWKPTEPREALSWGRVEDVIRNVELEQMLRDQGRITRPSDGAAVKRIAFVQCGGSSGPRPSYCSSICCLTSMKQALCLRESVDDGEAYIVFEHMRAPGHYESFYRRVQEDPGIFPLRGQVTDVTRDEQGRCVVSVSNGTDAEDTEVTVDLVVVAAGMEPNAADGEAIRALEDARVAVTEGESDAQRQRAAEAVEKLAHHEGTRILNLDYRQGPDLPTLEYGFPDSHFICFPYETRRTGIYATGAVRQPVYGTACREDATGAALKAIQCVEMTARGEAVHPRAGDRSYPDFFMPRCTLCKRCTEECPFGVLNEDDKGTPLLRATRCRRCGVCMGACPERIVSFKDYSVETVTAMIKAVDVPDEFEEKPRFLALLCENDALPAFELMAEQGLRCNPFVRVVPVRCLGSVNTVWIREALSAGYDGIALVGCRYGDDYQCHFIKGSELASRRTENVRETLESMALEHERLELHELQISEYARLPEILDGMLEMVEEYGMNPFKGL